MKFLVSLAILGFIASANAQVHCTNPGSVLIPASVCCNQVAGQGLGGAMAGFFDLMDLECKLNIFFDRIITDPDVLEFFNYITGPEFRELLLSVQNMQEFKDFMEYFCFNLDMDMYLYLNTLGDILGTPRIPHPQGNNCHPDFPFPFMAQKVTQTRQAQSEVARPYNSGVRLLFDDLGAEIPNDAIYDMWTYKVANDPYLCPAFLKLSGPDFRAIALKMEFHPEFMRFVQKLEDWGIQMNQFMDDLKVFLWDSDYCR